MGLTIKESGGSFTPCPAGTHLGICIGIYDLGTQVTPFKDEKTGEPKMAKQVFIQWELPTELMDDGRPFTIGRFYTASLNEKANLRHDLESWRGREFTPQELEGFSLNNVLGKCCMVSVIRYNKSDGTQGAKIGNVMALPKGMACPSPKNEPIVFDIDAWDDDVYAKLDEYWQKSIASSTEGKARLSKRPAAPNTQHQQHQPVHDDDIPF